MTTARRHAVQALILTPALIVFWIGCVATFHVHEMIVGAVAVVLSVAFCLFVVRTLPLEFRPELADLLQAWRLPWYILVDLVQIVWVLVLDFAGRPAPSLFRSSPWGPVKNNGRETAQRALAVAYTTVSPNCIVIGIDCQRRQLLYHQLRASELPIMTRRLGAGDWR